MTIALTLWIYLRRLFRDLRILNALDTELTVIKSRDNTDEWFIMYV